MDFLGILTRSSALAEKSVVHPNSLANIDGDIPAVPDFSQLIEAIQADGNTAPETPTPDEITLNPVSEPNAEIAEFEVPIPPLIQPEKIQSLQENPPAGAPALSQFIAATEPKQLSEPTKQGIVALVTDSKPVSPNAAPDIPVRVNALISPAHPGAPLEMPATKVIENPAPKITDKNAGIILQSSAKPVANPQELLVPVQKFTTAPHSQFSRGPASEINGTEPTSIDKSVMPQKTVPTSPLVFSQPAAPLQTAQQPDPLLQLQSGGMPSVEQPRAIQSSYMATQFSPLSSESQGSALASKIAGQISVQISKTADPRIEIRLDPPELGRVIVSLSPTETGMQAIITAERPEIVDLMRRHAELLAAAFEKAGFDASEFTFQSGQDGENSDQADGFQGGNSASADTSDQTEIDNIYISGSALDIRL